MNQCASGVPPEDRVLGTVGRMPAARSSSCKVTQAGNAHYEAMRTVWGATSWLCSTKRC
jgi:hypothetical protein